MSELSVSQDLEIWKPVIGWESFYEVSNMGRLKFKERVIEYGNSRTSTAKEKIRSPLTAKGDKYARFFLESKGKRKMIFAHRLVAMHFVPNPYNLPQVNHKDCNKLNNCHSNLEWVTPQENIQHSVDNDLNPRGERIKWSLLQDSDIPVIRYLHDRRSVSQSKIAELFGVDRTVIGSVIRGKTWKHVK